MYSGSAVVPIIMIDALRFALEDKVGSRLLGVENPSVSRWETGTVDLTGPAYRLVCLLAELEGSLPVLERL